MECLVDDKFNSNLPATCPRCGADASTSLNIIAQSRPGAAACERCGAAVGDPSLNNNPPVLRTHHHDIVPSPSHAHVPCRCSCHNRYAWASQYLPIGSPPGLDPAPWPHGSIGLHGTETFQHDVHSSRSLANSAAGEGPDSHNLDSTPRLFRERSLSAGDTPMTTSEPRSVSGHLFSSQMVSSDLQRPRGLSDSPIRMTRYSYDQRELTCSYCSNSGCSRNHRTHVLGQDGSPAMLSPTHLNLNESDCHDPTNPRATSDLPVPFSSGMSPTLPVVKISPSEESLSSDLCPLGSNQNDLLRQPLSTWGLRSDSPFTPASGRVNGHAVTSKPPVLKTADLQGTRGDLGSHSPSPLDAFSHNMRRNRDLPGQHGRMLQGAISPSSKGSRAGLASLHLRDSPGTPCSRQGQVRPRPNSLSLMLPSQLLWELHDLEHSNEDLSADVIYSLRLRNYEIKEVLGKGISSTVRRVTEKTTGVEYAVKIIDISGEKGEAAQVEQTKKDTIREIRILRMCGGHPNIIELHDVFETPTFIFLVFEICKKGELFDYLTSVVSLSEKRTRIFMRQLIEAVEFFHKKNIVHRDLKPENILLDDNLNIKVSDFGFATVVEDGEELTELCGTPGYLAPEVLAHSMYENVSGYGKEVDMWACGVIMYTLLCGAPPFWNRRQMMMLRAIMNADYSFNSPEWDDISDAPKNLIKKLLVVNPQQRLTASQALAHPFFNSAVHEGKKFQARRKFRAGAFCVIFYLRLSYFYKHPPPISVDLFRNNPYGVKLMRKVIDTCAFGMYKHWVKRVDNQNRAALFEHTLRDDWKHRLITVDGVHL